ncbi:MotE family protein [Notoacmeibacter sp. MSK16QG-6]|uniref:MotE family protein n=1 Tax=Notoacmeibacter sp. MSK16QG-6 TaxID=2957982 RepID=UPI00209E425D|nr:MotE family protein [Notoacmeibacter sp. MSK16QG-6]MCP1200919.1 MotE family protein [Notoacmeibacter sp. MSK16QG-6]
MSPRFLFLSLAFLLIGSPVHAADEKSDASGKAGRLPQHLQLSKEEVILSDEAAYCDAIVDQARELRYSAREEELQTMQSDLERGLELMERKKAEFEKWVQRREDFATRASEALIAIYERMRPDAAAERLTIVDPMLASAILLKMPPGKSGTILNEMEAKKAAGITAIMAASADRGNG